VKCDACETYLCTREHLLFAQMFKCNYGLTYMQDIRIREKFNIKKDYSRFGRGTLRPRIDSAAGGVGRC